jgi:hypothetical protein
VVWSLPKSGAACSGEPPRTVWEQILAVNGPLQSWEPKESADPWVRRYSISFANATLIAVVNVDPATRLVAGLHFVPAGGA